MNFAFVLPFGLKEKKKGSYFFAYKSIDYLVRTCTYAITAQKEKLKGFTEANKHVLQG